MCKMSIVFYPVIVYTIIVIRKGNEIMKCPFCGNEKYFGRLEIFGGYGSTIVEIVQCYECDAEFSISYDFSGIDRIIERGKVNGTETA